MHLPLLNAFDPYALSSRARRDKAKEAGFEPFVVASALEKPGSGRKDASGARQNGSAPDDEDPVAFQDVLAFIGVSERADEDGDEAMPEDAIDGQGLCALLEAATIG